MRSRDRPKDRTCQTARAGSARTRRSTRLPVARPLPFEEEKLPRSLAAACNKNPARGDAHPHRRSVEPVINDHGVNAV
jgi:hypothetical protein